MLLTGCSCDLLLLRSMLLLLLQCSLITTLRLTSASQAMLDMGQHAQPTPLCCGAHCQAGHALRQQLQRLLVKRNIDIEDKRLHCLIQLHLPRVLQCMASRANMSRLPFSTDGTSAAHVQIKRCTSGQYLAVSKVFTLLSVHCLLLQGGAVPKRCTKPLSSAYVSCSRPNRCGPRWPATLSAPKGAHDVPASSRCRFLPLPRPTAAAALAAACVAAQATVHTFLSHL